MIVRTVAPGRADSTEGGGISLIEDVSSHAHTLPYVRGHGRRTGVHGAGGTSTQITVRANRAGETFPAAQRSIDID